MGLINLLARSIPNLPYPSTLDSAGIARLQTRLNLDGHALIVSMVLGYVCFLVVTITEGRYFRVQADIDLATEVHQVLVPAITVRIGDFEFYGRSLPSGEVGGDLMDLAGSAENWVAYVADASRHGVPPGVVMGMEKSAARLLLRSGDDATHLATRLNEVLYPLKKPDMFVTFCLIARTKEGLLAGLAGHPPIFHFSASPGSAGWPEAAKGILTGSRALPARFAAVFFTFSLKFPGRDKIASYALSAGWPRVSVAWTSPANLARPRNLL
jgi:hypothetical protein